MKANRPGLLRQGLSLGVLACAILAAVGCGTAEYQSRLDATLEGYKRTARFNELGPPLKLAGGNVTVRVPTKFQKSFKVSDTGANLMLSKDSIVAPFLNIPGATLGYIESAKEGNETYDYHCYVAVLETPKPVQGQPRPGDLILAELNKAFPKSEPPLAWKGPVNVDTDEGDPTPLEWYTLTIKGDQFFNKEAFGNKSYIKLPGTFELWFLERADYTVFIGWRVPTVIENLINFRTARTLPGETVPPLTWPETAKLVAGTVKIFAPPAFTPEASAELGDEVRIGAYKMRIPAGFKPAAPVGAPLPGTQVLYWTSDAANTLKVSSTIPPAGKLPQSLEQVLFVALRNHSPNFTLPEPVKHGKLGELRFIRAKFQVENKLGVLYVGTDGATIFEILGNAADEAKLKVLDAAATSFTKG